MAMRESRATGVCSIYRFGLFFMETVTKEFGMSHKTQEDEILLILFVRLRT